MPCAHNDTQSRLVWRKNIGRRHHHDATAKLSNSDPEWWLPREDSSIGSDGLSR